MALDLAKVSAQSLIMAHRFELRVYYEDTDLAGIVYYANYLKFIERARTDWVRSLGIDQTAMLRDDGMVFAVRRVEADYLFAAKFEEVLTVETSVLRLSGARIVLRQRVLRGDVLCFEADITLVTLRDGKPSRMPQSLVGALSK